jgi:hypothetical protein
MGSDLERLPLSYRLSQALMLAALATLASMAWGLLSQVPQELKVALATLAGTCVASSLLVSGYVVIRFPLLSLAPAIVGDRFDVQIGTRHRRLVMLLRILALVFFVTGAVLVPWKGLDTVVELLFVGYAVVMIPVLVWLLFAYDSVSSPIVATLSRSTFGIGIVAFPLYLPLLFIGAMRCLWDAPGPRLTTSAKSAWPS